VKRWQEIQKSIEEKMDARDRVYRLLDKLKAEGKQIPPKYLAAWHQHMEDPRPWREVPGVMRIIKKAAKRAAKNEKFSPDEKKKMADCFLKRHTK